MSMKGLFENSEQFGVCQIDTNGRVAYQNNLAKSVCGDNNGQLCDKCTLFKKVPANLPIKFFRRDLINGVACEGTCYCETQGQLLIFNPLEKNRTEISCKLPLSSFTSKEQRIVDLLLESQSNKAIQDALNITKATLKTHLNHIYAKAPQLRDIRDGLRGM